MFYLFSIFIIILNGVASAGAILNFRGALVSSYKWSLGIHSNKLAEAYGLCQGLKIVKSLNIHNLIVIGDSLLIIKYMQQGIS
jgi:ribonuclease HI